MRLRSRLRTLFRRPVPALFLHIQKTAGTSLLEMLRGYYGGDNVISHGDYIGHAPQEFQNIGFVSGHFGFEYARSLMRGRYCFTFLRDPEERVLSMYYFCRNRNPNEFAVYERAQRMDMEAFFEEAYANYWERKEIWNNQAWQLAYGFGWKNAGMELPANISEEDILGRAKAHIGAFDYIGFQETFADDFPLIMRALNLPVPRKIVQSNVTRNSSPVKELPSSIRKLLDKFTGLDKEIYHYARSKRSAHSENNTYATMVRP